MQCVVSPHEAKRRAESKELEGAPASHVRPQSSERMPTMYEFGELPSAETAKHDPSVSQFNVHTAAAGPLGADVDCVHVCPASAVDKNIPIRCGGELELVPLAVGASPLTLKTQ